MSYPNDPNMHSGGYPPPHGYVGQSAPYGAPPPGYPPPHYSPTLPDFQGERGHLLRAFIGNNADRYLRVFSRLEASRSALSWNWSAFFANIFWLAYRKLYIPAAVVATLMTVMIVVGGAIGLRSIALLFAAAYIVPIVLAAVVGVFGDGLLKKRADSEIAGVLQRYPDPQSRFAAASASGGTSGVALAIALVGWFAIQTGFYATDLSAYKYFEKNRYQRSYNFR